MQETKETNFTAMKLQKKILSARLLELIQSRNVMNFNLKEESFCIAWADGTSIDPISGTTDKELSTVMAKETTLNYFDFNKQNKITCIDQSKHEQETNEHGRWKKEKRQELKPGKFLGLFEFRVGLIGEAGYKEGEEKKKVLNKMIENFVSQIASNNQQLNFELSETPSKVYDLKTKTNGTGHLSSSCMRPESNHGCSEHSEAYNKVGENVKVIYKNSGEGLLYRALLWTGKTEEGAEPIQFIDRIYSNESTRTGLENYATENGFAYRNDNGYIIYQGEKIKFYVDVKQGFINYIKEEGTPYFDTLTFCNDGDNTLSNDGNNDTSGFDLQMCSGNSQDDREAHSMDCENCGDHIEEDDLRTTPDDEHYCYHCFDESYFYCDSCNETQHNNDYATNGMCTACASDEGYMICDGCHEWGETAMWIESEDQDLCEGCCEDYYRCEGCEENHHIDNTVTSEHDEEIRCTDCHEEHEKEHKETETETN